MPPGGWLAPSGEPVENRGELFDGLLGPVTDRSISRHLDMMSARSVTRSLAIALLLAPEMDAQVGTVTAEVHIGESLGGFGGSLDAQDFFGWSVAGLGDLDGNGVPDLAVGSPGRGSGSNIGNIWTLLMNADGTVAHEQEIGQGLGGFGGTVTFGDFFGFALASLGDLDGDGTCDLAVGIEDALHGFRGGLWILFLNPNGTVKDERRIGQNLGGFGGNLQSDDRFGAALAGLGDLNGDGVVDLAVGAPRDDDIDPDTGCLWILFLNPDGTVDHEQQISESQGGFGGTLSDNGSFGGALTNLGDLDGDGVIDLAVGMGNDSEAALNQGSVWILFLSPDGTVQHEQKISTLEGGFGGHLDPFDFFGRSVANASDLNGDRVVDLAVGAFGDDDGGTSTGSVWILFLNPDGTVSGHQKISALEGGFGGQLDSQDWFGSALGSAGDLDGDGFPELVVGAYHDADAANSQGSIWILSLTAGVRLDFEREDDFATALANGQDLSTPPEFGNLVAISSSGPNAGAALFDSTPGGPNDPSQDRDLLVDSGNLVMLQTDANTTQTVPGYFDRPNDDEDGGAITFVFTTPVEPLGILLVDIDAGADEATQVLLTDAAGRFRVFSIPPGWTGDLLEHGVGKRMLDLATLAPQPGFSSVATAVEDPGFTAGRVVTLTLQLGSSGALDDLCWLPKEKRPFTPHGLPSDMASGPPRVKGPIPYESPAAAGTGVRRTTSRL